MKSDGAHWTGKVELIPEKLEEPLHWRKPCRVFVNSMSDLFHEALPDEVISRVFAVMALCPQHIFQVLTKRPARMLDYIGLDPLQPGFPTLDWIVNAIEARGLSTAGRGLRWPLANVWLGVSVEDQVTADERIPLLLRTPAAVRFVSYEPALAKASFESGRGYLTGQAHENAPYNGQKLDWVIVGGESGAHARPFDLQWARDVRDQCKAARVACFIKQLGTKPPVHSNRNPQCTRVVCRYLPVKLKDRKGGDMEEWPEDLRIREFPR
jgi:protein gp37